MAICEQIANTNRPRSVLIAVVTARIVFYGLRGHFAGRTGGRRRGGSAALKPTSEKTPLARSIVPS